MTVPRRYLKVALLLFGIITVTTRLEAQNLSKIEKYIEQARIDWGVPGMSVAIVKDGEVILSTGFGEKKAGSGDPVDENTLFAIASNTKAFVASSLSRLVMQGKISWKDPVTDYLPSFSLYDPYATAELAIEDLLCHRSGLGTYSGDVIWYKSNRSAAEVIEKIRYVPQSYSFRGGYGYSNLMYITAGEVIKAVTGQSWAEYAKAEIMLPLGMERTLTSTSELDQQTNIATPHKPVSNRNLPIAWTNWDNMGAAGGIISSAADMASWLTLHLKQGIANGDTLFSPAQQNKMWTLHNNFTISEESKEWIPGRHFNGYGLGWGLYDYYGRMVVTHSGGYDGMYSRVALVPDEDLGLVILTNSMTGITTPLMLYVINAFIREDEQDWSGKYLERDTGIGVASSRIEEINKNRKAGTKPNLPKDEVAGYYYDPMYGHIFIKSVNNQLRLEFEDAPDLSASLEHWHYDTYEIKWDQTHAWFDFGVVQFKTDAANQTVGLTFEVPNYDIFFHEISAVKVK